MGDMAWAVFRLARLVGAGNHRRSRLISPHRLNYVRLSNRAVRTHKAANNRQLKAMGVEGIDVTCRDCRRSASLGFDVIGGC